MNFDDHDLAGKIPASSVVIKGLDATTFSEMEAFVRDLESRPIERLLRDLPGLASLSATKFSLVSYVISAKFKQGNPEERSAMLESVSSSLEAATEPEVRKRINAILHRLR